MVKKILVLMVITMLTVIVLSGCLGTETILLRDGFEQGWGDWQVDMDLPIDEGTGEPVNAGAALNDSFARTGNTSIQLSIDGRHDDGTIWIERQVEIEEGREISIEISFYVYSDSESFNVIAHPVAYAGVSPPNNETDFTHLGNANVAEGWNQFEYERELTVSEDDPLWVAIGITVAWETFLEYELDDVEIRLGS